MVEQNDRSDVFFRIPEKNPGFKGWDFVGDAMDIDITCLDEPEEFVKSDGRFLIPSGTIIGDVAYFNPKGTNSKILIEGINDLQAFFQKIDELKLEGKDYQVPTILYGSTNTKMSKFAERLGFEKVRSSDFFDDGDIIAPLELVRERFGELMSRVDVNALKTRASKQSSSRRKRIIREKRGLHKNKTKVR